LETKKFLIVLILRILETDSSKENPYTQVRIANEISKAYPCDRKTVGRNIKFLMELKFPIVKTKKGFYMDGKTFSLSEIDFVKTAIMGAEGKSTEEKDELVKKLTSLMSKKYDMS